MSTWDEKYLKMAAFVAEWSKDPSTKCGAVIVRPDNTIVSLGYNGFPKNMEDSNDRLDNREDKYSRVVHCEMNAILNSKGQDLKGCTLYVWPFLCCDRCAVHVIQAGIKDVVYPTKGTGDRYNIQQERVGEWRDYHNLAESYFNECGVSTRDG